MREMIFSTLLLIASGTASVASGLPRAGNCESETVISATTSRTTHVEWSGTQASVTETGAPMAGEVVGLREHSGGFKLSVFYDDPLLGPSEAVVFSMTLGARETYRMGIVTYDELADGTLVVGTISGFEDARCALLR